MDFLTHHEQETRPWGFFERFTLNEPSTVKIIHVKPHQELSLQTHHKRAEFWYILTGIGEVTIHGLARPAKAQDEFEIPAGASHRIAAGPDEVFFLEIALGNFSESDETRLEDDYGRNSPAA